MMAARLCLVTLALLLWQLPMPMLAQAQASRETRMKAIEADLDALRLEDAEQRLASLPATMAGAPEFVFLQSMLQFHRGDYAAASDLSSTSIDMAPEHPDSHMWRSMRTLQLEARAVTQSFVQLASPDGRYLVQYPPGKDAVIAPMALEVLTAADEALEAGLGVRVPGPIRLEIIPDGEALARISGLSVESIETSGTVALSKWSRLMVTSPKALVRGYPWADTITHELVHMVLSRATGDQAPVWFQEGVAKLFERSWRGNGPGVTLDGPSRHLLEEGARRGELITFEEMHPSMALLPSQEAAALAFAQVATLMDYFVQAHGASALRDAVQLIEQGQDARKAVGAAAGSSFAAVEKQWRRKLPRHGKTPKLRKLSRRFRKGAGKVDESEEVTTSKARRHLRVGDMLWDRGRPLAAAIEYDKAHEADRLDPIVAARLARAALQGGDPARALRALKPQLKHYPEHAPTHAMVGEARLRLGDREGARTALREAVLINPFDPLPHCGLAKLEGDAGRARRASDACSMLGGP